MKKGNLLLTLLILVAFVFVLFFVNTLNFIYNLGQEAVQQGEQIGEQEYIYYSPEYYRVFVTDNPIYNGSLGGLSGADMTCQGIANINSLGGKWMAWLSANGTGNSVRDRFYTSKSPYNSYSYGLLNGTIIANNWADLTDGTINSPIDVNETGGELGFSFGVITGTNESGGFKGDDCNGWTSVLGTGFIWGTTIANDVTWTDMDSQISCNIGPTRLYCFEQPSCGDGIVQPGEDCESSSSPICDANTCKFNAEWSKEIGTSRRDLAKFIKQTSDGGYIVVGDTNLTTSASSFDIWLLKTDSLGNVQWNKTFGGNLDEKGFVAQEVSNGFVVVGSTNSFGSSNSQDVWLLKVNFNGDMQWNKTFGGVGSDAGIDVKQTSDNGFVITGFTSSFGTNTDAWVIKTDVNGSMTWNKTFNSTSGVNNNDYGKSIQQTADGGYIVLGTYNTNLLYGSIWLFKLNSTGDMQWDKIFGTNGVDSGKSVEITKDGGYIISAIYDSFGEGVSSGRDYWLIKTDSLGNIQWNKTFDGGTFQDDEPYRVVQTLEGGYIITGSSIIIPFPSLDGGLFIVKTNPTGVEQWRKMFGYPNRDEIGHWIETTSDGGFITAGSTGNNTNPDDVLLIKMFPEVICGNGIVQGTEQCDDGNTNNGDGCSSTCTIETAPPPGNGGGGGGGGGTPTTPQCRDGRDNDADGKIDYPNDTGCSSREDNSEINVNVTVTCVENWGCSEYSPCIDGIQTRTCNDVNNCGAANNKPTLQQTCEVVGNTDISAEELEGKGNKVLLGLSVYLLLVLTFIVTVIIISLVVKEARMLKAADSVSKSSMSNLADTQNNYAQKDVISLGTPQTVSNAQMATFLVFVLTMAYYFVFVLAGFSGGFGISLSPPSVIFTGFGSAFLVLMLALIVVVLSGIRIGKHHPKSKRKR